MALICLLYLAIKLGKEDGRWGLFTGIMIVLLLGAIVSLFD